MASELGGSSSMRPPPLQTRIGKQLSFILLAHQNYLARKHNPRWAYCRSVMKPDSATLPPPGLVGGEAVIASPPPTNKIKGAHMPRALA